MTAHPKSTEQEVLNSMIINLPLHKLRTHPMNNPPKLSSIPFSPDICRADPDLFCLDLNPLEKHVINCAPFLSFDESLHCYNKTIELSNSEYKALNKLWKRSRVATCSAVMDIWIKDNPTEYLNFTASGKRLGDYIKSIGVTVK